MSGSQENASSDALATRGQTTGSLVVGIGASAGGIAAIRRFFRRVPADSGFAFVVIVHISAEHESNLAAIVQNETSLPVMQVNETVQVEPNRIYVNPPGKYLVMERGTIRLAEPERLHGAHTSVDLFLRTLADAYQRNSVAMILSGTGSDGTLGLRRIKEQGGFAIVQDPDEAEYAGMPRRAIETGLVDLILPVGEIPEKLRTLALTPRWSPVPAGESDFVAEGDTRRINEILALVRQRTGHDFGQYKQPTLFRRISRRRQVLGLGGIESYLSFLRCHPEETGALLRDLLITVTNFFRDHEAFHALGREVIPKLFEGKRSGDHIRVWVVGCATGEEAYSIAIQLREYAASMLDPPRVQIFATDIDEVAIAHARDCHYRDGIALDVSAERLRQFFHHDGESYQVKKELRDSILFASHNVLHDPPFAKIDLISCRNLLMYLERETQEKVLGLFHFALKPGAFLFWVRRNSPTAFLRYSHRR